MDFVWKSDREQSLQIVRISDAVVRVHYMNSAGQDWSDFIYWKDLSGSRMGLKEMAAERKLMAHQLGNSKFIDRGAGERRIILRQRIN
jgi:hypothetical protein